ncbi:class I lanthipeptide [Flavobacterium terrae]|uniref:Uncharacterized protein n=1 Tax=Flavobacterium terrae TaxID=415425 RepID=A0A1M6AEF5_9FLAO|nr:class I lanthipeptide [Flavobacterium terrae]SHI34792.1 hypothetical protein SAMN05444363_0169 [Flavobacterium terrae]
MKKSNNINKLNFNKTAVVELNDSHLNEINGGTGGFCATISAVSGQALSLVGSAIASAVVSAAASIVAVSVSVAVYTAVKEN